MGQGVKGEQHSLRLELISDGFYRRVSSSYEPAKIQKFPQRFFILFPFLRMAWGYSSYSRLAMKLWVQFPNSPICNTIPATLLLVCNLQCTPTKVCELSTNYTSNTITSKCVYNLFVATTKGRQSSSSSSSINKYFKYLSHVELDLLTLVKLPQLIDTIKFFYLIERFGSKISTSLFLMQLILEVICYGRNWTNMCSYYHKAIKSNKAIIV